MNKQYETKDGQGALFKNEDRESETHPNYRGNIRINGQEYWLSAWLKESKGGKKYMSLSAQPKQARDHQGGSQDPPDQRPAKDDFDDDIPF